MDHTSSRVVGDGPPGRLPDAFSLTKLKGTTMQTAVCMVFTHRLGRELRLAIEGHAWETTTVVSSPDDIRETVEHWRAALLRKGWS